MRSSIINIGSRVYSIASLDDESFDVILAQNGVIDDTVKSFIDYDSQLILVRMRLNEDHRRELLLHEIIHACIEDAGVHDEHIERFVSILAPRLVQLIDNLPEVLVEAI